MKTAAQPEHASLAFRLSCWGLGTIAFTQLLVAGVGLAGRFHQAQKVQVVEKEVTKVITVTAPAPAPKPGEARIASSDDPKFLPPPLPPENPLPPARALNAPPIADPEVERLVIEARKARSAGDMATALLKLEEAREKAPGEPNALYETGLVFEDMAAADPALATQASDAFQAVYKLGVTGAGSLYQLAARKLSEGIQLPDAMRGQLSLGRPRIFKDDDYPDGERVVVTVPIRCSPGTEVDIDKIEARVTFYDSTPKNGILQASDESCHTEQKWVSMPFDFATGEELLQVTYIIPTQTEQQMHLFGRRKYYGQVVELSYNGSVMDNYSWPRHLASQRTASSFAAQQPQQPADDPNMVPDFLKEEDILDLNPGSVLPVKPSSRPPAGGAPDMSPITPVQPTPLPR